MISPHPSSPEPRSKRLADSPAVSRGGHWWLFTDSGAILPTDPGLAGELDRFAAAMADANQAVAELRADRGRQ
ncbi:hypothetical protein GCM10009665_71220 [Kitasatospora nipponensis]|uniref:Uncharacterized protein n=1 Tax=Kitasatospora nipponensis TaxID=258049 RepID=A0ABP4HQB6_9ACTN